MSVGINFGVGDRVLIGGILRHLPISLLGLSPGAEQSRKGTFQQMGIGLCDVSVFGAKGNLPSPQSAHLPGNGGFDGIEIAIGEWHERILGVP